VADKGRSVRIKGPRAECQLPGQARLNGISIGQMFGDLFIFGLVTELAIGVLPFLGYIVYMILTV
jgi:hypothetical protein